MDWRSWSIRERALLRDLALVLAAMLVVGVYFLERLDTRLQAQQHQHLQALAGYLAGDSAEYLTAGNRVSLGVIARQAAELDTVATLVVRDMDGRELARSGPEQSDPAPVQQAADAGNGPVGRVEIWPATGTAGREGVEAGFVLVVLLLLVLRVLVEVIRRQLGYTRDPAEAGPDPDAPGGSQPRSAAHANVMLCVEPARLVSLRERYTRSALKARLADYEQLLDRVVALYGGTRETSLDEGARVVFAAERPTEAAFQALCAGQVFLTASPRLATSGPGRAPAFRILLTGQAGVQTAVPEDAETGAMYVSVPELDELELEPCVVFTSAECLRVSTETGELRLQPVSRLVPRYQHLITTQADKLVAGEPGHNC